MSAISWNALQTIVRGALGKPGLVWSMRKDFLSISGASCRNWAGIQ